MRKQSEAIREQAMTAEEYFLLKVLRGTNDFSFYFNENHSAYWKITTLRKAILKESLEFHLMPSEHVFIKLEAFQSELHKLGNSLKLKKTGTEKAVQGFPKG